MVRYQAPQTNVEPEEEEEETESLDGEDDDYEPSQKKPVQKKPVKPSTHESQPQPQVMVQVQEYFTDPQLDLINRKINIMNKSLEEVKAFLKLKSE